jgi:large subunit ribosomal protein L10
MASAICCERPFFCLFDVPGATGARMGRFFVAPFAQSARKEEIALMATKRKEGIVARLSDTLRRAKAVVLVQAQGITVAEQTQLRKKMRADGLEFQVVKNTLFRLATREANVANIDPILNGPTAAVFGFDDEIGAAKATADYVKTSKIVTIKAGILGPRALTVAQVESLATLPSSSVVRAQAVGAVLGPAQQTVGLLSAPLRDLIQVMRNYAEKQGATF